MDIELRVLTCQLIDKMNSHKQFSEQIGLVNESSITKIVALVETTDNSKEKRGN